MKPLTDACTPRGEVLGGVLAEDIFAAELTPVVAGTAPAVYGDAATFFANTYPTEGLQALAREVFTRLSGRGGNPLIRLETTFGGGKTHGLIALYHVAREAGLAPAELLDADLRPEASVRTAAISGRDFGPEGRHHEGAQMHTLWGEIAWQLGGQEAYDLVAEADRQGLAPSGDAMSQVLGDTPALVMLDEIGRYLRVAQGRKLSGRGTVADQVPPFLHALAAAASTSPRAVVVISLAAEQDAYQDENEEVRLQLQRSASEIQKITARQELVIRPTQDAEVAHVVVRRLFSHVDRDAASQTARAYHEAYQAAVDKEGADLPVRVARLRGAALHHAWEDLMLMLMLHRLGVRSVSLSPAQRDRVLRAPEEVGVRVALLAAAAAPLRKPARIEAVASAVRRMSYEEVCYWYAHTRAEHGRRALRALRILLAPE